MPTAYCRHIRTNGRRCCSPALRATAFCYYHGHSIERHRGLKPPSDALPTVIHPLNTDEHRQRDPILAEYFSGVQPNNPLALDFPPLEDRESIQVALSMLISALGQNRLDPRRASTILYGLQVASANAVKLNLEPGYNKAVTSTVIDSSGQELAPDEDPQEITEFNEWLAEYEAKHPYDEDDDDEYEDDEQEEDDDDDDRRDPAQIAEDEQAIAKLSVFLKTTASQAA